MTQFVRRFWSCKKYKPSSKNDPQVLQLAMSVLIFLLLPHLFSFESDISNDTNNVKYIQNEITRLIVNMSKNSITLPELQSLEKEVKDFTQLVIQKNPEYTSIPIDNTTEKAPKFNNNGEKDTNGFGYIGIANLFDAISALKLHVDLFKNFNILLFDFSKIRSVNSLLTKLRSPDTLNKIPNEYKQDKGWNYLTKFPSQYFGRELFNELKGVHHIRKNIKSNTKKNFERITLIQNRITKLILNISKNPIMALSELQSLEEEVKDFIQLIIQKNPEYSTIPVAATDKTENILPKFNESGEKDTNGFGYTVIAKLSDAISALKLHVDLFKNFNILLFDFSKISSINSLLLELMSPDTLNKIPDTYKQDKGWNYLTKLPMQYFARELFNELKGLNNNRITLLQNRTTKLITDIPKNLIMALPELQSLEKEVKDFTQLVIQKNPEYTSIPVDNITEKAPKFNNNGEKDTNGFGYAGIADLFDAISAIKLHVHLFKNFNILLFDFSKIDNINSLLTKLRSPDTLNKIPDIYKQDKGWNYLTKFPRHYFGRELFNELKGVHHIRKNIKSNTKKNFERLTLIQNRITKLTLNISQNPIMALSELQSLEEEVKDFIQLIIQKNPEYSTIPVAATDKTENIPPKFNEDGEKDINGFGYAVIAKLSDAISALKLHVDLFKNFNIILFDFSKISSINSLLLELRSPDTLNKIPDTYKQDKGWNYLTKLPMHYFGRELFNELKGLNNTRITLLQNRTTKLITDIPKNLIMALPELQSLEKEVKDFTQLVIQKNSEYTSIPVDNITEKAPKFNNNGEKDTNGFGYAGIADLFDAISAIKLHVHLFNNFNIILFDFSKIDNITSLLTKLRSPDTLNKIPNEYKQDKGWNYLTKFPRYYFGRELFNKLAISTSQELQEPIKNELDTNAKSNNINGITPIQKRMIELITNMSKKEDPTANLSELQELIRNELEAIDKNTSDIDSKSDISLIEKSSSGSISTQCKNNLKLILHSI